MSDIEKHLERLQAEQKPITAAEARIIELLESIEAKLPDPYEARQRHFSLTEALSSVSMSNAAVCESLNYVARQLRERG